MKNGAKEKKKRKRRKFQRKKYKRIRFMIYTIVLYACAHKGGLNPKSDTFSVDRLSQAIQILKKEHISNTISIPNFTSFLLYAEAEETSNNHFVCKWYFNVFDKILFLVVVYYHYLFIAVVREVSYSTGISQTLIFHLTYFAQWIYDYYFESSQHFWAYTRNAIECECYIRHSGVPNPLEFCRRLPLRVLDFVIP